MKKEAIKQNLQQSVLFKDIGPEQLAEITDNAAIRHVPQGDFVHRKGDQADTFYIVAMGEAELTLQGEDGALSIVGRVGPGGHFTGGHAHVHALIRKIALADDPPYGLSTLLAYHVQRVSHLPPPSLFQR